MTTDQLQVANEINEKIIFHKSEWKALESKAKGVKLLKNDIVTLNFRNSDFDNESAGIRKTHLISILQVEAQYHYQEMRKYERKLKSILVWNV